MLPSWRPSAGPWLVTTGNRPLFDPRGTRAGVDALVRALLAPQTAPLNYALAVAAVFAMTIARSALGQLTPGLAPFGTYFPAVVYAALVGGLGPGLVSLGLGGFLAGWLYVPEMDATPLAGVVNIAIFVVFCLMVVVMGAALRDLRASRVEAERLFTAVQEMALDGFVVFRAIRGVKGDVQDLERIYMNSAAERIIGPARLMVGRRYLESSPTLNRDHLFERYLKVLETGVPAEDEFRFEAGQRWIYNLASRIDADRLAITFRDVTETRATIERQRFLMRELNHRVKNVLTSVLSLARQTSVETSAVSYREALTSRIAAMARAHDLLMTESWEGALLSDVVHQTLAPYDRIFASGPRLSISPDLAIALNMALHELATNATKYGALSTPEGHVDIRWAAPSSSAATLQWRETGGPPVSEPTRKGFGTRLLSRGFTTEARHVDLTFEPSGLACSFTFEAQGHDTREELSHRRATGT